MHTRITFITFHIALVPAAASVEKMCPTSKPIMALTSCTVLTCSLVGCSRSEEERLAGLGINTGRSGAVARQIAELSSTHTSMHLATSQHLHLPYSAALSSQTLMCSNSMAMPSSCKASTLFGTFDGVP